MNAIVKNISAKTCLAVLGLSVFLTGCASYKASSLTSLYHEDMETEKSSEIMAVSKVFSKEDCEKYLDRNVIKEGYQPVQVTIFNNTEKNYVFSTSRISVPVAQPHEVAQTVHTSTVGRAVGYGIGGLIVWPLFIPAIVDGIGSSKANSALDHDFATKAGKDQVITPKSRMNAILFIPTSDYKENFSITLLDEKTKEPKTLVLSS